MKELDMSDIEKTILFGGLFDLYGKLLSPAQESVMRDYYERNFTLSEIAENREVSRQAIYDAVMKAQKKLLEIEDKVGAYSEILKLRSKNRGLDGNI